MRRLWFSTSILVLLTVAGQPTPGYAPSLTFFTGKGANSVRQYTLTQQRHTLDTGNICILVYNDVNGSTVRDPGEPMLGGAVITITNSSGIVVAMYTTNGVHEPYCFANLVPDTYRVEEQNPAGYPVSTTPDVWVVPLSAGGTVTIAFGDQPPPKPTPTDTITSTPAATATPTTTPTATSAVGALCVLVYNDLNGNKSRDAGEPLLSGAVITVTNSQGITVGTWTTNGTEPYCFYLPAATYTVLETDPLGYASTTPNVATAVVTSGLVTYVDFGDKLAPTATPTLTPTFTPTSTPTTPSNLGALCVLVYNDLANYGTRDVGEPLLTGAMITVTNSTGVVVSTWTTNGTEPHCFQLPPGNYTVTEQNPTGYVSTTSDTVTSLVLTGYSTIVEFGDRLLTVPTSTPTPTPTSTSTSTSTPTPTPTPTATPTPTVTPSLTATPTPTPRANFHAYLPLIMKRYVTWVPDMPTPTLTATPSHTPTQTPTSTCTPTPTPWCDPYEPNNDRYTNPWGPLQSAQSYQAKLCTGDAEDNYYFDVGTTNPVQLRLQLPDSLRTLTAIWLYTQDHLDQPISGCGGWVNTSEYTTTCSIPQLGRYIIRIYAENAADNVNPYTLRATFQ